jgi:hypothetical protein
MISKLRRFGTGAVGSLPRRKISPRPVMDPEDLAKACPSIGEAAAQYGK